MALPIGPIGRLFKLAFRSILSHMSASTARGAPIAQPSGSAVRSWLVERLGLRGLTYAVPEHANSLPYLLGGITLTGFVILFLTGIYLAQFYHPHPGDAHDSVVYIITGAPLGDLVRSVHFWVGQIVVLTVLLHLLRILSTGSFKRPREINWYVGLGLLTATFAFAFTGTVLKFDQEALEALQHNIEWAELVGGFGAWFSPEFSQSLPLLTRVFVGHIAILPLLLALLIAAHVFLIKQHGISPEVAPEAVSRATAGEGRSHFDLHLRRMAGYGLLVLAIAIGLSLVFPAPLGLGGVAGAEVTRPPWMFVWLVPLEELWGLRALVVVPLLLGALLALVPILDRSPYMHPGRRRLLLAAAAVILVAVVASGLYAELKPVTAHLNPEVPK